MRNRYHGAALGESFERNLNLLFALGIEGGSRFVEQENRRILEQRARNGETLLLSAGEKAAFVADDRVVTLRLSHDEVMRVGGLGGGVDFFLTRIEPAELDVTEDAIVKEKGILRNESYLFTQSPR